MNTVIVQTGISALVAGRSRRFGSVPLWFAPVICVLGLAGCQAESESPPPSATTVDALQSGAADDCQNSGTCTTCSLPNVGTLLPNQTDSLLGVTAPDGSYGTNPSAPYCYAKPEAAKSNGKLFVFLPGSGAVPSQYQKILVEARALGYSALSLSWPNGAREDRLDDVTTLLTDITATCKDKIGDDPSRPDCWAEVRNNRYDGSAEPHDSQWNDRYEVDPSYTESYNGVTVPVNSVRNRLTKALIWLGWTQFLNAGQSAPLWDKIVFSGHSGGGGLAAFIGSKRSVRGVATFSSPDDARSPASNGDCNDPSIVTDVAAWVKKPFSASSPMTRFIGLIGCGDPGFTRAVNVWSQVTWPDGTTHGYDPGSAVGSGVKVDGKAAPYKLASGEWSHQLYTSVNPLAPHSSTVLDALTPDCLTASPDGTKHPKLRPAWQQVLIVAGGLTDASGNVLQPVAHCSD